MNLYMKQQFFSWKDKFFVYDESGAEKYYVEGEVFSWGKKLHLYDNFGNECAFIEQKVWSFLPKYYVSRNGVKIAEVVKEFAFFKNKYTVSNFDWEAYGDFWDHEYEINNGVFPIVTVCKEWFSLGDAYRLSISDEVDEAIALSVVLVIDACIEAENN